MDGAAATRALFSRLTRGQQIKTVKTPVMTLYYGVTRIGAQRQVRDRLVDYGVDPKGYEAKAARTYIADMALRSAQAIVPGATQAKDFIAEYAHRIAKAGHLVSWKTPAGWTVRCWYGDEFKGTRVETPFGQLAIRDYSVAPSKVKTAKFKSATPANFVHGVDQAHATLIANSTQCDIIPVHDCFASHCGSMQEVHQTTLDTFAQLHRQPLLHELQSQWCKAYPEVDPPEIPELGDLDIEQVRRAQYAFA